MSISTFSNVSCAASAPGVGIYNTSVNFHPFEYNYCNAPHVSAQFYDIPDEAKNGKAELVFLNVIQRHHKRTPDNLYPQEQELNAEPWECNDARLINYAIGKEGASSIYHLTSTPEWHPLQQLFWNGTCDQGQLSPAGLSDSIKHGRDFFSVYGPRSKTSFLSDINTKDVYVRTSPEERTFQVAGGLLQGMGYDSRKHGDFPVHTFPSNLDDIVPNYSCSHANDLRNQIQSLQNWTDHISSKKQLFDDLNKVVNTANLGGWNSWIDHHFDALSSRTCHQHSLPKSSQGQITQDLAMQAFAEGDFEYDFIWNSAGTLADDYVKYSFGIFVNELSRNLKAARDGKIDHKLKYYVGHDGTMVRLLRSLSQAGQIRWPAMGSEVVLEVWQLKASKEKYVRILSYGRPLCTTSQDLSGSEKDSTVLWTPIDKVIQYLDSRIPADLVEKCLS